MEIGKLQDFTIDQFAGSLALILGSLGGLLMIIWKSRCHCKFNLCYICQCERKPAQEGEDSEEDTTKTDTTPSATEETPPLVPDIQTSTTSRGSPENP